MNERECLSVAPIVSDARPIMTMYPSKRDLTVDQVQVQALAAAATTRRAATDERDMWQHERLAALTRLL